MGKSQVAANEGFPRFEFVRMAHPYLTLFSWPAVIPATVWLYNIRANHPKSRRVGDFQAIDYDSLFYAFALSCLVDLAAWLPKLWPEAYPWAALL